MIWNWKTPSRWQRLLVALLIVAVASAIRVVFFGGLGKGIPYLLYFPAVTLAALYGGLLAGCLATTLSAALVFFWIQQGSMSLVELMALAVFFISSTLISFICEAMRRAQERTKLAQEKAEAANQELRSEVAERKKAEAALRETNEYLDNLFNHANAPIIVWDTQFKITRFNHAFESLTGRRADEVIGKSLEILFPSALVDSSMTLIKKTTGGERWETVEIAILHLDGSVRIVLWNSATVFAVDGKTPVATIAQGHDITARKRADAALRASEQEFRSMAEAMPQIAWATRPDGWNIYFNQQWVDYTGLTLEESYGHGWNTPFHPDDRQRAWDAWQNATQNKATYSLECRLRRADGAYRWWLIRGVPLRNASGETLKWFGTCTDIEDIKQAQEAVRASEARYRLLFETTKDGILTLDAETGMITDVNPFLIELLGFSREAFLGKKVWQLGFFKDIVANQDNFAELQQKEYLRYEDMALETSDGRRIEVEFTSNVYQANHQKAIQCNIRDISERKRAAAEIHKLNAELEQRVVERTAQLDAVNKELEAFSYSVSHDLRAPLRHVQGYVDMLSRETEGRVSDKGRRYMKTIADASRDMGALIDDLLAFSRMGRAEMCEVSVNLDELVQATLRDMEPDTRERNIVWKIPSLPAVQADAAMLKLVLANLLGNAVKFTRPRAPAVIEVGMKNEEGGTADSSSCITHSTFFVRDNGVGFDPQYVHKLFGIFQRLHRAEEFEGTGIGLANVRRIITRHGGRTWAEGKLNEGATFYFTLKLSPSPNPVQ